MTIQVRWAAAFGAYEGAVDGELEFGKSEAVTPRSITLAAGFTDADRFVVQAFVHGKLVTMDTPLADGHELLFDFNIHAG